MANYYFALVVRVAPDAPWKQEFGAHDKETVNEEKDDTRADDKARKLAPFGAADCYKVICVKSAKKAHINAAIKRLNSKGVT